MSGIEPGWREHVQDKPSPPPPAVLSLQASQLFKKKKERELLFSLTLREDTIGKCSLDYQTRRHPHRPQCLFAVGPATSNLQRERAETPRGQFPLAQCPAQRPKTPKGCSAQWASIPGGQVLVSSPRGPGTIFPQRSERTACPPPRPCPPPGPRFPPASLTPRHRPILTKGRSELGVRARFRLRR